MRPHARFGSQPQRRAAEPSGPTLFRLILLVEIFARDLLFGHVGELEDKVDDLILIDRRTKLGQRVGVVAIVVPDLFLAARHLAGALNDRAADLVISDRDLVLLAD